MNITNQDRWTVLNHAPKGILISTKGKVSESWLCVDCGVNTGPGIKTRKEMDVAMTIHGEVIQTLTPDQEIYLVTDEVWKATGLEGWGRLSLHRMPRKAYRPPPETTGLPAGSSITRRIFPHRDGFENGEANEAMRLVIAQYDYLPDGDGLKVCQPDKTKALARIVPDTQYPTMWRVVRSDGSLSDILNKTRAMDLAFGRAEIATYLRSTAECEPPFYGHFLTDRAAPMRSPGPTSC